MGAIHKQNDISLCLQCLSTTSKGMLSSGKLTASRWDAISSSSSSRSVFSSRHSIAGTEGKHHLYCTYVDVTCNAHRNTDVNMHPNSSFLFCFCVWPLSGFAYRFTPNRSFRVCVYLAADIHDWKSVHERKVKNRQRGSGKWVFETPQTQKWTLCY